jgi:histone deacetylase complex subunit SAP18
MPPFTPPLLLPARLEAYAKRGAEPPGEVQVYTWPDATLRELAELVKEVRPDARRG